MKFCFVDAFVRTRTTILSLFCSYFCVCIVLRGMRVRERVRVRVRVRERVQRVRVRVRERVGGCMYSKKPRN